MKELTKAEEQVMQVLWKRGKAFVKELVEDLPNPKPAYNTISTIIRILEKKGFVDHKAYGKTYEYFPLVDKTDYTKGFMKKFMKNYFGSSVKQMVSFFSQEENLSVEDLQELIDFMEKEKEQKLK